MRNGLHRITPYAVMALSIGLTGFAALTPVPNPPVAAVFPPWWTIGRSFNAAAQTGASIVRFGGFANIVVLTSGSPGLNRRLHEAGAWLVLDADALGGCALNT